MKEEASARVRSLDFSYQELAELMIRKADIHEGFWHVQLTFSLQGLNMPGTKGEPIPSGVMRVEKIGLMRSPIMTELTVDAAKVWEDEETRFLAKIAQSGESVH